MATTIVTKKGSGAPAASDLVEGELAVDTTNGRLYTENSSAAVVELGSNPSGNITFGDNGKAIFGAGSDLQIYHSGSHSFISEAGTGDLYIGASNNIALMNAAFSENKLLATTDGALTLYHDGSAKLATTATGVDVSGTVTADGLTSAGDAAITGSSSGSTVLTLTSNALADTPLMVFQRTGGAVAGKLAYEDTNTAMSFGTTTGHELKLLANNTRAIQVDSGGDISFYEDTGTTPKFFWDASAESLGIGTSSPSDFAANANNLVVGSGSGTEGITINSGTANYGVIYFADGTSGSAAYAGNINYNHADNSMRLGTNGSTTDVVIDSSGRLLHGTTDSNPADNSAGSTADNGVVLNSGAIVGSKYNDRAMYLNRTGSDGEIIELRKSGLPVGSIGTQSDDLNIGNADVALRFADDIDSIIPFSQTANADRGGAIDLGYPSAATLFKDLYLSGGAYLGGTTAANKLEDYEEGLWTLIITTSGTGESVSIGSTTGTYTKIGRQVTATIYTSGVNVSAAGSGAVLLGGLPFTCSNGIQFYAVPSFGHTTLFSYEPDGYVTVNTNYITVTRVGTTTSNALSVGNPRYMMMTVTYFTDS